jgi:hypothetical protein
MAYTTIDKPDDYFNTVLYTGTGATASITGVGFQPDWVWIKERSASASDHNLSDAVRGAGKALFSNTTGAEYDYGTGTGGNLRSFDSDGFSLGTASQTNANGTTFVSWCWDANGAGVSNTAGSITSTVSANTTSGFSIVSYTGNGTDNDTATIGHGLGVAPNFIITKCRSEAGGWISSSTSLGWNNVVSLNTTDASSAGTQAFGVTGVTPSSITFTVSANSGGNHTNINNATYIAYCFAEKKGFSKFGSYTGNGNNDGTFVYTGFRPAFVLSKCSSAAGEDWNLNDNKRPGFNVIQNALLANSNSTEVTASYQALDFTSNGFKWRGSNDRVNGSGKTYIYMAFAENPFVTSTSIPTTAR